MSTAGGPDDALEGPKLIGPRSPLRHHYFSRSQLRGNGWTNGMISRFLGGPKSITLGGSWARSVYLYPIADVEAGVWPRLHELLLAELHGADKIDWRRALIDRSHARARAGG